MAVLDNEGAEFPLPQRMPICSQTFGRASETPFRGSDRLLASTFIDGGLSTQYSRSTELPVNDRNICMPSSDSSATSLQDYYTINQEGESTNEKSAFETDSSWRRATESHRIPNEGNQLCLKQWSTLVDDALHTPRQDNYNICEKENNISNVENVVFDSLLGNRSLLKTHFHYSQPSELVNSCFQNKKNPPQWSVKTPGRGFYFQCSKPINLVNPVRDPSRQRCDGRRLRRLISNGVNSN